MRIIISPAKKMRKDTDTLPWRELPEYVEKTQVLLDSMKGMTYEALKRLWKCNDKIAEQNIRRLEEMDLRRELTPAILAYDGIQYKHMAAEVFTQSEYDYVQEHVRILSGFYGILRPFDGITPYRLEMQAKLSVDGAKDLYDYWGDELARSLMRETDCILDLASKEYSGCMIRHLKPEIRVITCIFGEEKNGKITEKGTLCKMARGEMVRCMAQRQIIDCEEIKRFDGMGFAYSAKESDSSHFVFVREANTDNLPHKRKSC